MFFRFRTSPVHKYLLRILFILESFFSWYSCFSFFFNLVYGKFPIVFSKSMSVLLFKAYDWLSLFITISCYFSIFHEMENLRNTLKFYIPKLFFEAVFGSCRYGKVFYADFSIVTDFNFSILKSLDSLWDSKLKCKSCMITGYHAK